MATELMQFAKIESNGKVLLTAKSGTPAIDGYDFFTAGGLPYHAHPIATPDLWKMVEGAIAASQTIVTPYINAVDEAALSAQKRSAINAAAQGAVSTITDQYPQFEINTFDAQEREARAWLLDNNTITPTLSIIALGRGIALTDLVGRVIVKADLFRPLVAAIIAQRQALEDQLDAIDLEAADAVAQIAAIDETQLLAAAQQLLQ